MDLKRLPNRELIQKLALAEPDDPLWREFVTRFRPRVRLAVFRSFQTEAARNPHVDAGAPGDIVDDLTQEVFVRLLEGERRALSRFRGRTDLSAHTYLSAIAVNLVRDHFKSLRAHRAPSSVESQPVLPDTSEENDAGYALSLLAGTGPERYVASNELRDKMRAIVSRMSPEGRTSTRDRLVFELYFVEGLTVGEIAADRSIGLSASGVEKCLRRIRDALQRKFSASGGR